MRRSLVLLLLFSLFACVEQQANDPTGQAAAPRLHVLQLLDPTPDLMYDGDPVRLVAVTGFDANGNQVFGPVEDVYDEDISFLGFPAHTTRVEVEFQRAQGYTLATHSAPVDFPGDDDGVIVFNDLAPQAAAPKNTLTVRVVNNSAYPDEEVFLAVNGKNQQQTAFFFLNFAQGQFQQFGGLDRFADYSHPLSLLTKEAEHTYSFQCPIDDLVSGRVYVSFGAKLQGLGLVNPNDPLSLRTPSPTGVPDAQTLWEFMELSVTNPGPTLFTNTSVVDFFSVGLGMTLSHEVGGREQRQTVGFVPGARDLVLAEFEKAATPVEFRNYVRKDGTNHILRVLSPVQGVAIAPQGPLSMFLDAAINAGWAHYAGTTLNIPDNLPTHTFGYQYTGMPIVNNLLSMTCTVAPDPPSQGEVCNLPRPTSRIVFFCDDDGPLVGNVKDSWKNAGTEGHRRLCSLLSSALNRGVFENYPDWGNAAAFYTRPDGRYNHYAKVMHQFAIDGKVYGFGYDDVYGQDPTLVAQVGEVNQVILTIPAVPRL